MQDARVLQLAHQHGDRREREQGGELGLAEMVVGQVLDHTGHAAHGLAIQHGASGKPCPQRATFAGQQLAGTIFRQAAIGKPRPEDIPEEAYRRPGQELHDVMADEVG